MVALVRFLIMGFVVLTVIYGSLWFYLRARRKAMLELDWNGESGQSLDDYVDAQLPLYDKRRHRMLVALVYVLPLCAIATIFYVTNYL